VALFLICEAALEQLHLVAGAPASFLTVQSSVHSHVAIKTQSHTMVLCNFFVQHGSLEEQGRTGRTLYVSDIHTITRLTPCQLEADENDGRFQNCSSTVELL
jgi:hypothetical protein